MFQRFFYRAVHVHPQGFDRGHIQHFLVHPDRDHSHRFLKGREALRDTAAFVILDYAVKDGLALLPEGEVSKFRPAFLHGPGKAFRRVFLPAAVEIQVPVFLKGIKGARAFVITAGDGAVVDVFRMFHKGHGNGRGVFPAGIQCYHRRVFRVVIVVVSPRIRTGDGKPEPAAGPERPGNGLNGKCKVNRRFHAFLQFFLHIRFAARMIGSANAFPGFVLLHGTVGGAAAAVLDEMGGAVGKHFFHVHNEVRVRRVGGYPQVHAHMAGQLIVVNGEEGKGGKCQSFPVHFPGHVAVPAHIHTKIGGAAAVFVVKNGNGGVNLIVGTSCIFRLFQGQGTVVDGGNRTGFIRGKIQFCGTHRIDGPAVRVPPVVAGTGSRAPSGHGIEGIVGNRRLVFHAVVNAL